MNRTIFLRKSHSMPSPRKRIGFVRAVVASLALLSITEVGRLAAADVDFQRDIAPILEERCRDCHGADEQESGLRLDIRAHMLKGGDSGLAAIVPGHPEKSYLIDVVKHLDADVKMPPDEDRIPANEIELLDHWIKQGAVWPGQMEATIEEEVDLWSFQPVIRPEIPRSPAPDGSASPIDAFLLENARRTQTRFLPAR